MGAVINHQKDNFADTPIWPISWLFPISYLLHIGEEYYAGFPAHLLRTQGIQLSAMRFLLLQGLGLTLMVLGIVLSRRFRFQNQMLVILAAVVIGNSCIHVVRTIVFGGFEPGLVTSLLAWLPLGVFTLFHLWGRVNGLRYFLNAALGLATCGLVELITISKR